MRFAALVVALVAVGSPLAAQQAPPPGAWHTGSGHLHRRRIANEHRRRRAVYRGRNDAALSAALSLERSQSPESIPLGKLRSLEVSLGRKPSPFRAAVGFQIGGTVGFFAAGCLGNRGLDGS
jgi:hypothetical protein